MIKGYIPSEAIPVLEVHKDHRLLWDSENENLSCINCDLVLVCFIVRD